MPSGSVGCSGEPSTGTCLGSGRRGPWTSPTPALGRCQPHLTTLLLQAPAWLPGAPTLRRDAPHHLHKGTPNHGELRGSPSIPEASRRSDSPAPPRASLLPGDSRSLSGPEVPPQTGLPSTEGGPWAVSHALLRPPAAKVGSPGQAPCRASPGRAPLASDSLRWARTKAPETPPSPEGPADAAHGRPLLPDWDSCRPYLCAPDPHPSRLPGPTQPSLLLSWAKSCSCVIRLPQPHVPPCLHTLLP